MTEFLRKYLVPVYQAPDPAVDPPLEPAADPVVADPVVDPPADPEPAPPPRHGLPPAVINELTGLRGKNRELETERDTARREAREARELAERLTRSSADPAAPVPAAPPRQPASGDEEVNRRAAEIVFAQNARTVSESGVKQFGQGWVDAVNALDAYGVNSVDFVSSVMEIDRERTHEIMHTIAQDGEKAMQLAAMTPARRIAEITRISMTMAAPAQKADPKTETPPAPKAPVAAPKLVSKAPAPPPPVDPSATKIVDGYSDAASDDEFTAEFNKRMKARSARR